MNLVAPRAKASLRLGSGSKCMVGGRMGLTFKSREKTTWHSCMRFHFPIHRTCCDAYPEYPFWEGGMFIRCGCSVFCPFMITCISFCIGDFSQQARKDLTDPLVHLSSGVDLKQRTWCQRWIMSEAGLSTTDS